MTDIFHLLQERDGILKPKYDPPVELRGSFPLNNPWWAMHVRYEARKTGNVLMSPPAYVLRDDPVCAENLLMNFMVELIGQKEINKCPSLNPVHLIKYIK